MGKVHANICFNTTASLKKHYDTVPNVPCLRYSACRSRQCSMVIIHVPGLRKLEAVHKRFTKRLPGLSDLPTATVSSRTWSEEPRTQTLRRPLVYVYKILLVLVKWTQTHCLISIRDRPYADTIIVYVPQCVALTLLFYCFFADRVINPRKRSAI